jgi:hypothetical protein
MEDKGMYERDQETYDRTQRSYRPNRDSESKLERIKREVKSWFDDDDDDFQNYEDRNTGDDSSERFRRRQITASSWPNYRQHGTARDNESAYSSSSTENYESNRGVYRADDRNDYQRSATRPSEPEYVRYGDDYYLRDRGAGYGLTSAGPVSYAYASYWRVPGPYAGTGPKGYKRSSDGLKEQVCERLENDGRVNASEIEVEVDDCEVTLVGKVPSREQKRFAEDCAESVHGIKDVHNRLTIERNMETRFDGRSGHRDSTPSSYKTGSGSNNSPAAKTEKPPINS